MNVLNATELYIKILKVNFRLCIFFFTTIKKYLPNQPVTEKGTIREKVFLEM